MSRTAPAPMHVPVLIVGGGPVGLALSISLAQFGVRSLVAERHQMPSPFPKGRILHLRTVEILRQLGPEEGVTAGALPREQSLFHFSGSTLTASTCTRVSVAPDAGSEILSPTWKLMCSQNVLERVLRRQVGSLADFRLVHGVNLVALTPERVGVTALSVNRASGEELSLRARYVVGADGHRSTVRRLLGIPGPGGTVLAHNLNILFDAKPRPLVDDRISAKYRVARPEPNGVVLTVDNDQRWVFGLTVRPADDYGSAQLNDARCSQIIRGAVGAPDLPVRIIDRLFWHGMAEVDDVYRQGRVLIAGDAPHVNPPNGTFGLSCGSADAHDLAWKLAAVVQGWAGPDLLSTYESERRSVAIAIAIAIVAEAKRRLLLAFKSSAPVLAVPSDGSTLGYTYDSTAVVAEGDVPRTRSDLVTVYRPTASPGRRVPHFWLNHLGVRTSVLDLLGPHLKLLTGPDDTSWCTAAHYVRGVPLTVHRVGSAELADPSDNWPHLYEVSPDGAVLVRPDGHVAWRQRGRAADPATTLDAVLAHITSQRSLVSSEDPP